MARKKTDPWSPAAYHEIARGTIKTIGKHGFCKSDVLKAKDIPMEQPVWKWNAA